MRRGYASEWTVLAPGPSLAKLETVDSKGPTVAVNRAVLSPLHWDIFCAQDGPKHLADCFDRIKGKLMWCSDRHTETWRKYGVVPWPHSSSRHMFKEHHEKVPIGSQYMSRTILVALGRIVGYHGTKITIYGCDMIGEGYAYGDDSMARKEAAWDVRWDRERKMVNGAIEAWRESGVEIVVA